MSSAELCLHDQVGGFLAGRTSAADLAVALTGCTATDTPFWRGVAHLEDGADADAADDLRAWLRNGATADSPLRPTAAALLAVAEGGLVEAVRDALETAGAGWRRVCPVTPEHLVAELAEADPALLAWALADLPVDALGGDGTRARAARAVLGAALDAEHAGLAHARLVVAERLLDGVVR